MSTAANNAPGFFNRYFDEADIEFTSWEIEDAEGRIHIIDSDVVIEHIHCAPRHEKKKIEMIIRKLDFFNAPIVPFLRHLAGCLVGDPSVRG